MGILSLLGAVHGVTAFLLCLLVPYYGAVRKFCGSSDKASCTLSRASGCRATRTRLSSGVGPTIVYENPILSIFNTFGGESGVPLFEFSFRGSIFVDWSMPESYSLSPGRSVGTFFPRNSGPNPARSFLVLGESP